MKHITFGLLLFISLILMISCQKDDDVNVQNSPDEGDTLIVYKVNIHGYIQKGPYINGTSVNISELDDSLVATGKNFNTQIVDNKGTFEIKNIELISDYVQLSANGFYFDEVKGEKSVAQLALYALANIESADSINVNVLSHLEKDRVYFLIKEGKSFAEAKKQTQKEILSIFGILKEDMRNSETLDISKSGEDNAILLAISVILQGNNTVADLSELLANINTDIKEDGKLDSETSHEKIVNNAKGLDLAAIREHVEKRYVELGVTSTIPNFEKYIDSDGDGILNGNEDDTPEDFTFQPQTDVAISQSIISNEITIVGIKEGGKSNISVSNGAFIINDQEIIDTVTQVANGDKVKVIATSSNSYNTLVKAKITIGSLIKTFEVTTDDYIPDDFSFVSKENVAINSFIASDTITLSGIPYLTPASIGNGIIIKNGVELETDTTSLKEGDKIAIKLLSSESLGTSTHATLSVNGVEGIFEVTTDDYIPDDFSFASKENVPIDSFVVSETITLSGIPHPTLASIENGSIIKNGIELTGDTTLLENGDEIAIKIASSKDFSSKTMATLNINGVEGTFEIITDDYVPNDFSFTAIENANRDTFYFSDTITLTGLLHPAPVTLNEGILIINNTEYNSEDTAWAKSGDQLVIKLLTSTEFLTKTIVFVQVGSIVKSFEITTRQVPWVRKADYLGKEVNSPAIFEIDGKVYICTGKYDRTSGYSKELYEYDLATNTWTRKADFGGNERKEAVGFSVNGKGYVGMGTFLAAGVEAIDDNFSYFLDFWEYDPSTDTWKKVADFPGDHRIRGVSFVMNNKAYVGLGHHQLEMPNDDTFYCDDIWEYNPVTNQWVGKNKFAGGQKTGAWAFALNGKAYVGTGSASYYGEKDVWEYNYLNDSWIQKNDYVEATKFASAFVVNNTAFVIPDVSPPILHQYDAVNDSWKEAEGNVPYVNAPIPVISTGEKGYLLKDWANEFWEFTPVQP